jgi:general transcription factor 3C polypeptide 4
MSVRHFTLHSQFSDILKPVLFSSKPGFIQLWRQASTAAPWNGIKTLFLTTQKLSIASTALAPVSGIAHIPSRDMIVVSLSDGSLHAIHNVSSNPSLAADESVKISSHTLSTVARQHCQLIEGGNIQKLDVNSTHGMVTADEGSTFLSIYEWVPALFIVHILFHALICRMLRPTEFGYKHEAQHSNTVIMAQLFHSEVDTALIEELEATIRDAHCGKSMQKAEHLSHGKFLASGDTPIAILKKYLIHLHDPITISTLAERMSSVLSSPYPEDYSTEVKLVSWSGELIADVRQQYKCSLKMHIFGSRGLLSRRLRVNLAYFCEVESISSTLFPATYQS